MCSIARISKKSRSIVSLCALRSQFRYRPKRFKQFSFIATRNVSGSLFPEGFWTFFGAPGMADEYWRSGRPFEDFVERFQRLDIYAAGAGGLGGDRGRRRGGRTTPVAGFWGG